MHPGEELTDEEFLEEYSLTFKHGGVYGVGRPDRGFDYVYNSRDAPDAWGFWCTSGDEYRRHRVGRWEPLRDKRLIGLLGMVIFPHTVD